MKRDDEDTAESKRSVENTGTARLLLFQSKLPRPRPVSRFDPYQGTMSALQPSRKRDLRKLEEWLRAKGMAEAVKREEVAHSSVPNPDRRPGF
jgi:hypothetical protein